MLKKLSGHAYYCFLNGHLGYNQIAIAPVDLEKTMFTCPSETFAYRRLPFELCNALATFQRCLMFIFSDMVEKYIEIFMDDFSNFGDSFDKLLENLALVLKRCKEVNLVINWEKFHFMVEEGIVLGHKISSKDIEVDKAKIEVISKLPPPSNVKGKRSFLGHTRFYHRFIKDFSLIFKPLYELLEKDLPFNFDEKFPHAFKTLKDKLVSTPILVQPDWSLTFKLMCDASDHTIGACLGQRREKTLHVIYFASSLTKAQRNYVTIEKALLSVVFAFYKFCFYLIGTKLIVYTDHAVIKFLLAKKEADE